jgi:hypothetical protein
MQTTSCGEGASANRYPTGVSGVCAADGLLNEALSISLSGKAMQRASSADHEGLDGSQNPASIGGNCSPSRTISLTVMRPPQNCPGVFLDAGDRRITAWDGFVCPVILMLFSPDPRPLLSLTAHRTNLNMALPRLPKICEFTLIREGPCLLDIISVTNPSALVYANIDTYINLLRRVHCDGRRRFA